MPQVTVLMSVHNGLPDLKEAVDSILTQTFGDFEFLIFDDASNDGSHQMLADYAAQDSRIRLVTNEGCIGLGASLARGVTMAQGTWIARADADDICLPHRLQTQYDFVQAHPDVDIVSSWALEINEHGDVTGERRVPLEHDNIARYIWTCPIIHPAVFFKKEAILKAGSYGTERRRQDYALWFRALKAGLRFANIGEPLIKYRFADSYFNRNSTKALLQQVWIGWKGCWLVKASPVAYIGVTVPLVRSVLPDRIQRYVAALQKRFDPRNVETH